MSKELQRWAVHVLRFALREPRVAVGDAVLHIIDTGIEGPGQFRGAVVGGERQAAVTALTRARAEHPDAPWALAYLTTAPPERTFLLVDCALAGDAHRFCTEIRTDGPSPQAGALLYLGNPPD